MKKSEVCFLFLLSLFCFACSDSADKEEMEFPEKDNLKVTFPSDFSPEWAASVAGKEVTIVNPLFVTQTYSGSNYCCLFQGETCICGCKPPVGC